MPSTNQLSSTSDKSARKFSHTPDDSEGSDSSNEEMFTSKEVKKRKKSRLFENHDIGVPNRNLMPSSTNQLSSTSDNSARRFSHTPDDSEGSDSNNEETFTSKKVKKRKRCRVYENHHVVPPNRNERMNDQQDWSPTDYSFEDMNNFQSYIEDHENEGDGFELSSETSAQNCNNITSNEINNNDALIHEKNILKCVPYDLAATSEVALMFARFSELTPNSKVHCNSNYYDKFMFQLHVLTL